MDLEPRAREECSTGRKEDEGSPLAAPVKWKLRYHEPRLLTWQEFLGFGRPRRVSEGQRLVQRQQHERATAILHIEWLRSQRLLLLLPPLDVGTAAFAASSRVLWHCPLSRCPQLGPLVNLAIRLRVLSHGISVRGNGCWPGSPAGGIII